uniref:Uncharacterized protein n=1 Tax=Xiphophorus couchianus TaxID=32473 RepID=A0A3B5MA68_9TELE
MGEDAESPKINHTFLRDYVTEADVISTVEFNQTGDLLATGDKGGRVVIFQRETEIKPSNCGRSVRETRDQKDTI